jgi:hypothetical protein
MRNLEEIVFDQRDTIGTLLETVDEQSEEIATLQRRVDPDPASTPFDDLTRDQRVHQLRVAVARKAADNGGKAAMNAGETLAAFDQHPSRGYAYKLMKLAANADGFDYAEVRGAKSLTVEMDCVTDEAVVHAVTTDGGSGGA